MAVVSRVVQGQNLIRMFLFIVFFSIGAAALGGSILLEDLVKHYRNRQLLNAAEESTARLRSLNDDYDALLARLDSDPNLLMRIAPVTLGAEHDEPNAVYPSVKAEQLAAARKALREDSQGDSGEAAIPRWLVRCRDPRRRLTLFLAGTCLILVSFLCFGPAKRAPDRE